MHHYEQALDWAKLILLGESPHCMQGQANAISLLFPMEAVLNLRCRMDAASPSSTLSD
jgi:5-methylcytosine-specific restriction endonuclease McrBC regulatory subunit McrC